MPSHLQALPRKPRRVNGARPASSLPGATAVRAQPAKLEITHDELLSLATDIACLRAARYREVDFATVRENDVRTAQMEIVALIKKRHAVFHK